jgi:hypothetical protein
MSMRIVRFICLLALLAGVSFYRSSDANAQGSPDVREACTPDAMRLCSEFIPDVAKITACMKAKHSQLSSPCLVAMRGGGHENRREARHVIKVERHVVTHERHHYERHHRERHRYSARGHCDPMTHLCS